MHYSYSLLFLFFTYVIQLNCSPILFNYITSKNCSFNATAYFDSLNLQCRNCINNRIANVNHLHCICPPGTIPISDGTCQKCEQGKKVSIDGHFCVQCSITAMDNQCSACPIRHFVQRKISPNGIIIEESCIKCPANNKVSTHGDTCIPCLETDDNCECQDDEKACEKTEDNKILIMIETEDGSQKSSNYIANNIKKAINGCLKRNPDACQHLANICVLQNYRTDKTSACTELQKIATSMPYNNNGLLIAPMLFYTNNKNILSANELLLKNGISSSFIIDKNYPGNFILEIILIQYALNGTYLGMVSLSESNLNFCSQQKDKFHFGTFYQMSCYIQLQHLLRISGDQPIFSDLFVVYVNKSGQKQMYSVPVINENIRLHDEFIHRLTPNDFFYSKWILTRRLYFVDSITLDATSELENLPTVRFPEKLDIKIQLQSQTNGLIMLPYVKIRHAEVKRDPEKQFLLQFSISYSMNESHIFQYIENFLYVLIFLSFTCALIKTYSWRKRSGKVFVDGAILIKLFFHECEILSDIFLLSAIIPSLFTLFVYKIQQIPQYAIFDGKQEKMLITYFVIAMVFKFISLLHCATYLILTETFFIDWERPHVTFKINNAAPISSDTREDIETTQPAIWRTYLVANEWNELQEYRKTSVGFQLITMIVLLHWYKLENWAAITLGFHTDIPKFTTTTTITELAIITGLYLTISSIQLFLRVTVLEQFLSNPFCNLIDLCSISNISVLALTHPLHGYYIHGRSVHEQADTDMITMNQYLYRERENLCGTRGLETGNSLQTYIINLPETFREQFSVASQILENDTEQLDKRSTDRFDTTTSNIQKIAKRHEQVNNFLMRFIEHNDPVADYLIDDAFSPELLFDIEFTDSTFKGRFVRDKSEMAYSGAFIYGNEWIFLSFELSLFCSIYILTKSYTFSAFIVYIVSVIIKRTISNLSTDHLVKSSFIDHRFLF